MEAVSGWRLAVRFAQNAVALVLSEGPSEQNNHCRELHPCRSPNQPLTANR